jgi:hypothetical protein
MSLTTEFEVEDQTLEPVTMPRKGRGKSAVIDVESPSLDKQAEEIAELAQEIASAAAKMATDMSLKAAQEMAAKMISDLGEKTASLESRIRDAENAKQKTKIIGIKLGELPAQKLKLTPAEVLPSLLAQAKIGMAGGNWPLMTGPTGCGKTVAAEQVAEALALRFEHVNCSEGMSETWLWGRQTPTGFIPGGLWTCFKEGGVFLFDEADAANDNVWLSINTMLANGHAYNPISGESVKRHKDFIAIAAANTNGKGGTGAYSGRSRLDGATLNRFAMFAVHYSPSLERELCPDTALLEVLWSIRVKLEEKKSADVISTRDIKNAYLQSKAGFETKQILECLSLRMDASNKELVLGSMKGKKK